MAAAMEALQLAEPPLELQQLTARLAAGEADALPPVELLETASMGGGLGAYAGSSGTIYLNAEWLQTADGEAVLAVLSEELGHHLDAILNRVDTPGDEGELFAALLLGDGPTAEQKATLAQQNDWGVAVVAGAPQIVELAAQGVQVQSTPIPQASPGRTRHEFRNTSAFAALRSDGSVVTWGESSYGGDSSGVDFDGPNNNLTVSQIFSTNYAFAALRSDGSAVTWGASHYGGDSTGVDFDGPTNNLKVARISSNSSSFAAIRNDGSVITWGHPFYGGHSAGVDFDGPNNNLSVIRIFSTSQGFAALRSDGTVVTWGDTAGVSDQPSYWSGDSSRIDFDGPNNDLRVAEIYSTEHAFAALRSDGSVVTWSSMYHGGDSSGVDFNGPYNDLSVVRIFSTDDAFAALRNDGSIVTWGNLLHGGNSSQVDFDGPGNNLSVSDVFSTSRSFAALRSDGSVVSWGEPSSGGDSSGVDFNGEDNNLMVSQIVSNSAAFAALRNNGTVVTWGSPFRGGISSHVDFDGSNDSLKVSFLYSTAFGFSAVRNDGSAVRWGQYGYDGKDLDGPDNNLSILQMVSNSGASAALRSDGSIVTWGPSFLGGDSYWIDFDGPENNLKVVSLANPFTDDWLVFQEAPIIPIISAAIDPVSIQENSDSAIIYTLTRTGPATAPLSVYYTISGSATAGTDYTSTESSASPGLITFASGEATATVSFAPIRDSRVEEDETITLTIDAKPEYEVATEGSVTATIIDTNPIPGGKRLLLAKPFPMQLLTLGKPFSLEITPYTFIAPGDTLTYSASLGDGSPLPSWLSFDAATRSLRGTPPIPGNLNIRLTATNSQGDSVSDTVALTIGKKSTDGWLGGYAHAIAVEGSKAYLVTGHEGLSIVDLSSPENPSILSRLNTEGYSLDVAVAGNYAFLAAGEAGLLVVNIEDPEQPVLKSSYDTAGYANAVAILGQYAYIADWGKGLQVINISDPLLPTSTASFDTPGTAMNVAVSGDYAYVADSWQGLTIIDLRMPSGSAPAGRYATGSSAYAVTVADGLAYVICRDGMEILSLASNPVAPTFVSRYVFPEPEDTYWIKPPSIADGKVYISTMNSGVHVLDISDPSVPKLLAILATTEANDLAVVGDEIIVADQYTLRVLDRNELDATPGNAEPLVAASLRGQTAYLNQAFSYQLPEQLFVDPGDRLTWAATAGDGSALPSWLHFDATTHTLSGTPNQSGSLNVRITATDQAGNEASDTLPLTVFAGNAAGLWSNDIIIRNNKAFTPSYSTLSVLDISTPLEPATASSISLNGYYSSEDDYELSGDSIYLVSTYGGLEIIDVKDHLNPQAKPGYRDGDYATAIAVNGSRAYLGGYQTDSFLKVLDISQPSGPVLLHTATANGTPNAIAISKQLAIVAYMNWEGIGIYDLTNPDAPQLIKELRTYESGLPGYAGIVWDIKTSGSLAYLAAANALLILNLNDPANPTFLGACALPSGWNRRLVVADGFAYLSTDAFGQDTNPGIAVVDVRTPSNPTLVEFVAADAPSGLAATSEYLYIASGYGPNGMQMMNLVAPQALNDGPANLFILGTAAVDATLRAALDDSDPDGDGPFSYAWQSSIDGSSWQTLGIGDNYTITPAEEGQQLRLLITYTDGQGFAETLTLSAGTVPLPQKKQTGLSKVTVTESPVGGSYSASADLHQEADDRPLLAIGIDESSLDLGGSQEAANNTVSIAAMVTTLNATATAIGLNASSLQLRPGDDTLTVEAAITGPGSGSDASVGVRDSLVSGNRGDDTITLRGEYWGDRALVFGGAGNDTITGYGIGRDSFIQAGDGDDVVSLGRLETTPGALPLQRAKGDPIQPSTYRGGAGFDVLHLRETTQTEFEAQATPFSTANESGWLFQGARFSGFEQFLFG
jgi:alpha-tubulin suppressor-like RCC1 family protein